MAEVLRGFYVVTISALVAVLAPKTIAAKPLSVQVDTAFDNCQWAAEVRVLAVGETVRVQVTGDADALFRGHSLLGKVVDVAPFGGGPASCRQDLSQYAGANAPLLMVVTKEGQINFVGTPHKFDEQPGYHLRSWCDWNGVWFYAKDKDFGQPVGDRFGGVYAVTRKEIAARFTKERVALTLALAKILARPPADLPKEKIKAAIARLRDDDFQVREAAQRELASLDQDAAEFLQRQADAAEDPEVRIRLRAAVAALESPLHRHAMTLRRRGGEHEAAVLRDALSSVDDGPLKSNILARLSQLAASARK